MNQGIHTCESGDTYLVSIGRANRDSACVPSTPRLLVQDDGETVPDDTPIRRDGLPARGLGKARRGMYKNGFTACLQERDCRDQQAKETLAIAGAFEGFLAESGRPIEPPAVATETTLTFSEKLIKRAINTRDSHVALFCCERFIGNDAVFMAAIELIGGAEAPETLHAKLGDEQGEDVRNQIFEGIEIPPLGSRNSKNSGAMGAVIHCLEASVGYETCISLLKNRLRYLEDSRFLDGKKTDEEAGVPGTQYSIGTRAAFKPSEIRSLSTEPGTHEVGGIKTVFRLAEIGS